MSEEGRVSTAAHIDTKATVRFAYSGDDLIYRGTHVLSGASTTATNWVITKYTYTSDDITLFEQLPGSWDGRAALGWT
jgi:hypothetical protein